MTRAGRLLAAAGLLSVLACAHGPSRPKEGPGIVFAGAGDIACGEDEPGFLGGQGTREVCAQRATSDVLLSMKPSAVFVLGDDQYPAGSLEDFQRSYDVTWGRLKAITHPAAGNHEYASPGAKGYFDYFGPAAGTPGEGYYSFELGSWHVVVLNSNCKAVDCSRGGPQERWLKADLALHPARCTLAYWHHPRFSSGRHGDNVDMGPLWEDLAAAGAELVLNGHDHDYERFAPQGARGEHDEVRGVREIIVGTGGKSFTAFGPAHANSEVRIPEVYGVLELTLFPGHYTWRFESTEGEIRDQGRGFCH